MAMLLPEEQRAIKNRDSNYFGGGVSLPSTHPLQTPRRSFSSESQSYRRGERESSSASSSRSIQPKLSTSSPDWQSYRRGERESSGASSSRSIQPKLSTSSPDWQSYRRGEREPSSASSARSIQPKLSTSSSDWQSYRRGERESSSASSTQSTGQLINATSRHADNTIPKPGDPNFIGPVASSQIVRASTNKPEWWQNYSTWKINSAFSGHGRDPEWSKAIYGAKCFNYGGGGFITGPDEQRYPIVIPQISENGYRYTSDQSLGPGQQPVSTLGGADPDWRTIYKVEGTDILGHQVSASDRLAAGILGTAGLQINVVPSSAYQYVSVDNNDYPALSFQAQNSSEAPEGSYDPERHIKYVKLKSGAIVAVDVENLEQHSREERRAVAKLPDIDPPRSARVADNVGKGVDLAVTLAQGAVNFANYGEQNRYYYKVKFEVNEDGRRRAIINAYHLNPAENKGNPAIAIVPFHAYIDEKGEIAFENIHYRRPPSAKYASDPNIIVVNNYDREDR